MRASILLAVFVSVSLPTFAQEPGMAAAQMATDQAMMASQQANQQAFLANQQAMQNAQQPNAWNNGPIYGPATLPKPKFSLKAGRYGSPQQLRLRERGREATIYYTTDGWTPTTASPRYDGPLAISATTHVQAIAVSPYGRSQIADAVYALPGATVPEPMAAVAVGGLLPKGTELGLTFAATVDSQTAQVGDKVPLRVAVPIVVDGKALLPEQVTAQGTVVHVDDKGHGGLPGVVTVRVDWLQANGVTVPLRAVETLEGTNHTERAGGFAVVPVVGVASLLQRGGQAVIPVGMPIMASVAADTQLRPRPSGGLQ